MLNRVEKMFDQKIFPKKVSAFFWWKIVGEVCIFLKSKPVQTGPDRSKPVQMLDRFGPVWIGSVFVQKMMRLTKICFLHFIKTYFKVVPHVFPDLWFFVFSSQLLDIVWTYPFNRIVITSDPFNRKTDERFFPFCRISLIILPGVWLIQNTCFFPTSQFRRIGSDTTSTILGGPKTMNHRGPWLQGGMMNFIQKQ